MIVRIKRQENSESESYWQEFSYYGDMHVTVAYVLDRLNYDDDLFDVNGNPARKIRWECSCMQKICGACAMIICGRPALACDTFLDDINKDVLVLEPLSKFPVVSDLIVDRSIIQEHLLNAGLYDEKGEKQNEKNHEHKYQISKCLKCGLCLEVCPNYIGGEKFYGAVIANDSYLLYSQNGERKKEIKKSYRRNFENGCSKSLACMDICPMKIQTLSSISHMNRFSFL